VNTGGGETDGRKYLDVDGRMILKYIFLKLYREAWTGMKWSG
jgi:hypothetical protein